MNTLQQNIRVTLKIYICDDVINLLREFTRDPEILGWIKSEYIRTEREFFYDIYSSRGIKRFLRGYKGELFKEKGDNKLIREVELIWNIIIKFDLQRDGICERYVKHLKRFKN